MADSQRSPSSGEDDTVATLRAQLERVSTQLEHERAHRSAMALLAAARPGVNLEKLATIIRRTPDPDQQWPALVHSTNTTAKDKEYLNKRLACTVFGIKPVCAIAGRVLKASSSTPAGILRSVLLEVTTPGKDLDGGTLSNAVAYIYDEAARGWPAARVAHLETAAAAAHLLKTSTVRDLHHHKGELTLECMQVGPIVRQALAAVFGGLHG